MIPENAASDMVGARAIMEFNAKIRPDAAEPSEPGERVAADGKGPAVDKRYRHLLL